MNLYELLATHGEIVRDPDAYRAITKGELNTKPAHPEDVASERPALIIGILLLGATLWWHHARNRERVALLSEGEP
jgi:hypothetical protein